MKLPLLSSALLLSLATMASAQYTPGTGIPYVPGPTAPVGPTAPTPPSYSWEAPPTAQPAPPQNIYPQPTQPIQIVQPTPVYVPSLSDAQMSDLTAAIALYPDPLLAEMFPSATFLEQLTFADRWLEQHPGADERAIQALPLDDNVKDMMHYPTVLNLMTDHLDWTQSMALAFTYQRQDLFDSIQRWRTLAVTNGYLYSTQQQDVLQQGPVVLIQPPARTQVIYVPVYDPAVVYVRVRPAQPRRDVITFSNSGFSLSFAFNDLDWHDHEVRVPRHDDHDNRIPDHPGPGGPPSGGRGGPGGPVVGSGPGTGRGPADAHDRVVFVPTTVKPNVVYPQKVVTPQPDKKVITLPPPSSTPRSGNPGRGPSPTVNPGRGPGGAGASGRPGGADGNPNTPF